MPSAPRSHDREALPGLWLHPVGIAARPCGRPCPGCAGELFSDGLAFPSPVSSSDAMMRDPEGKLLYHYAIINLAAIPEVGTSYCSHSLEQGSMQNVVWQPNCREAAGWQQRWLQQWRQPA